MNKVRLTTTLAELCEHDPCASGWATLLKSLPADYPETKPINLLHILESNGVQDMMWALRAATPDKPKLRVAICVDMAMRVLKHFEAEYPDEKRPRDCIKACRQFVRGKITLETLEEATDAADAAANAVNAAGNAAAYAAVNAAYAAANAAVNAAYATFDTPYAAKAAASAAAYAAASATERKAQATIIRKYLK